MQARFSRSKLSPINCSEESLLNSSHVFVYTQKSRKHNLRRRTNGKWYSSMCDGFSVVYLSKSLGNACSWTSLGRAQILLHSHPFRFVRFICLVLFLGPETFSKVTYWWRKLVDFYHGIISGWFWECKASAPSKIGTAVHYRKNNWTKEKSQSSCTAATQ